VNIQVKQFGIAVRRHFFLMGYNEEDCYAVKQQNGDKSFSPSRVERN